MKTTEKLNLNLLESSDVVSVTPLNENMERIENYFFGGKNVILIEHPINITGAGTITIDFQTQYSIQQLIGIGMDFTIDHVVSVSDYSTDYGYVPPTSSTHIGKESAEIIKIVNLSSSPLPNINNKLISKIEFSSPTSLSLTIIKSYSFRYPDSARVDTFTLNSLTGKVYALGVR